MKRGSETMKLSGLVFVLLISFCMLFSGCQGYDLTSTPTSSQTSPIASTSQPSQTTQTSSATTSQQPTKTAGNGPSLSIATEKTEISAGETFTVNILVNSSKQTRGAQFGIKFDPAVLQCRNGTEGQFYKNWAAENGCSTITMPTEASIDNDGGKVDLMAVVVLGQTETGFNTGVEIGAQGSGIIYSFEMLAKVGAHGDTVIELTDAGLSNQDGNEIPGVIGINGHIKVIAP